MTGRDAGRHAESVYRAIASGDASRSALVASWQRSNRLHALDPASGAAPLRLTEAEIEEARARAGRLLRVCAPNLDRLFLAVGGVGCSVLLADRNGVALDRRGAAGDDATFEAWGLWTGTLWSENSEGTNGIGTCLVEQRTLTIHRDQHFLARNNLMSCTTAPVFDEFGRLAAALDVSSCRADLTEGFVELIGMAVSDAARRIEAENFRLAFPQARIVLASTAERSNHALLAVDKDDLLIGATRAARTGLGITDAMLASPLPVADVLGGAREAEDFARAEKAVLQRALARSRGNVSEAARSLGISRATLHRRLNQLGLRDPGRNGDGSGDLSQN